jgi:hypothetical protein
MSKATLLGTTALAFLGLGKADKQDGDGGKPGQTNVKNKDKKPGKSDGEDEGENVTGAEAARADSYEDGDEPDEDDEPEDEDDDDDETDETKRKSKAAAARARNALRRAGHRRGVKAERARLAAVMNGLEPGKVELALHLALNTNLPVDQIAATLKAAPAGKSGGLAAAMARVEGSTKPGFAGAGGSKGPTLSSLMAATVEKMAGKKKG